jgi:hypothetical protein
MKNYKENLIYPPTINFNLLYQRPQFILKYLTNNFRPIFYDSNPSYEGAIPCEFPYESDGICVVPPDYDPNLFKPFHLYYSVPNHNFWVKKYNPKSVLYDLLDYPVTGQSWESLLDSLKTANNILVVSEYLEEIAKTYTKNHVWYVPNGVQCELYDNPSIYKEYPTRKQQLLEESGRLMNRTFDNSTRIIGYSGVVWDEIFDFDLLCKVANEFPDDIILMTGSFFNDFGELPKNVMFTGHVDRNELPHYMNLFDIAIIPFLQNNFAKAMCPLKYLEYCASGKLTVSTPIPEVEKGPCEIGACHDSFLDKIANNLEKESNIKHLLHPKVKGRMVYAKMNDWNTVLKPLENIYGDE